MTCTVSVIKGPPQLNREEEAIYKTTNRLSEDDEREGGTLTWIQIFTWFDFHPLMNIVE